MNDAKRKMLDKVRKLLSLAGSSNEYEAALAAERAHTILAQYNLSLEEVKAIDTSQDDVAGQYEAGVTNRKPWRRPLAQAVGAMYFCTYFYESVRGSKQETHVFVGSKTNAEIATMMFQYLQMTVDMLAKQGALSVPENERVRYRIAFRKACVLRLCHRIHERIAASKAGTVKTEESSGTNLPALTSLYEKWGDLNKNFIDANVGKMKEKAMSSKSSHAGGTTAGHEAGGRIGLDQQIDKTKTAGHLEKTAVSCDQILAECRRLEPNPEHGPEQYEAVINTLLENGTDVTKLTLSEAVKKIFEFMNMDVEYN